jgi:predicted Zn-dependent protease
VDWDDTAIQRWLEPLASRPGELAEVFGESLTELSLVWRDGAVRETRLRREEGTGARWREKGREQSVFVAGTSEASVREAVRALRAEAGRDTLPLRAAAPTAEEEAAALPDGERWTRRLSAAFARHAPRHRFEFRIRETERRVVGAGRPASLARRRLISLEGRFTAASRPGDEERAFAFHAPDSDPTGDELKAALSAAGVARDRAAPPSAGEVDAVLANGCAAVLFHEILAHPLEADAESSPLSALPDARVAAPELEVVDDPQRLDLFGGYEHDDEGTAPRAVRLVQSGRIGSRLTDRAHAGPAGSSGHGRREGPAEPPLPRASNLVVGAGAATGEELLRRLGNGLWIEEIRGGSLDLAGGTFRLAFPRARRVRRGRFADEIGPGVLAGELLTTLKNIEPALGREVHVYRSLGWCARAGQVVPIQGASPDVLIRRLAVRSAS